MSKKEAFSQREIRQALRLSQSQLQRYMKDLEGLEYVKQVGGSRNKGYMYSISYLDDYKALRERLKKQLEEQIQRL